MMVTKLTTCTRYGQQIKGFSLLAHDFDLRECKILGTVAKRLADYEYTGLTPEQIQAQQQEIDRLKAQATVKDTQLRIILENINKFPPEGTTIGKNIWIESTKAALTSDSFYHNPADTELIDALVSDKDEQAGRIMQLEKLAKDLYFAYINKDADCPHSFETQAIEQYKKMIGGEEDV